MVNLGLETSILEDPVNQRILGRERINIECSSPLKAGQKSFRVPTLVWIRLLRVFTISKILYSFYLSGQSKQGKKRKITVVNCKCKSKVDQQGKNVNHLSVTSNSSLSLKLKLKTLHIGKCHKRFLKFFLRAEIWVLFRASPGKQSSIAVTHLGIYMRSLYAKF